MKPLKALRIYRRYYYEFLHDRPFRYCPDYHSRGAHRLGYKAGKGFRLQILWWIIDYSPEYK